MSHESKDVLCERLLGAMQEVDTILNSAVGLSAFNVDTDARCAKKYNEFVRLRRSLEQYTEKSATLLYVGFVGHFSAGKSSTINSLIGESNGSRLTGLHPTDKAVTLITHRDNSSSLIGAHKRGELEVGSSLIDSELLKNSVVVDTPGSGDPSIVEEMVRDFLPICDRVMYTFSAAIPLDNSDLPVLRKVHSDLPFLPLRFIVTRAEEFRRNRALPLTVENWDQAQADTFIGDLIARLAVAVPHLNVAQEDVFLIDNLAGFNVGKLSGFVFPAGAHESLTSSDLHSHKIDYYQRSAKDVRGHFVKHVEMKLVALDSLIKAATSTREQFQENVTMANNRLTESWRSQQQALTSKQKGNTEWVMKLSPETSLEGELLSFPTILSDIEGARDLIRSSAEFAGDNVCKVIDAELAHRLVSHVTGLREQVARVASAEQMILDAPVVTEEWYAKLQFSISEAPYRLSDKLVVLPTLADNLIKQRLNDVVTGIGRIVDAIREGRVVKSLKESIDESIRQLEEMVAGFFKSVQLYRSAVLSMNARELAQRAGIVQAIDELEKTTMPEDKRTIWTSKTTDKIFTGRADKFQKAVNSFNELDDRMTSLRNSILSRPANPVRGNSYDVSNEFDKPTPEIEDDLWSLVRQIVKRFNEENAVRFQQMKKSRDEFVERQREELRKRTRTLAVRKAKKLALFAIAGSVVALLAYLSLWFWKKPFPGNWPLTIAVGVGANALTAFISWVIGRLLDRTNEAIDSFAEQYQRSAQELADELLRDMLNTEGRISVTDSDRKRLVAIIQRRWQTATDAFIRHHVSAPLDEQFAFLKSSTVDFIDCRDMYVQITSTLANELASSFSRVDENLQALAELSAEIREESITPSFSMFENRNRELQGQLTAMKSIEF